MAIISKPLTPDDINRMLSEITGADEHIMSVGGGVFKKVPLTSLGAHTILGNSANTIFQGTGTYTTRNGGLAANGRGYPTISFPATPTPFSANNGLTFSYDVSDVNKMYPDILKSYSSSDTILQILKGRGYHLTGSRRMLLKYGEPVFEKLASGLPTQYGSIVQLIKNADWDLFIDEATYARDATLLEMMGFEVKYDKGDNPYGSKLSTMLLSHCEFPIEITVKTSVDVYMHIFENIKLSTYIGYLWKSNPLYALIKPGLHKRFISTFYEVSAYYSALKLGYLSAQYSDYLPGEGGNPYSAIFKESSTFENLVELANKELESFFIVNP